MTGPINFSNTASSTSDTHGLLLKDTGSNIQLITDDSVLIASSNLIIRMEISSSIIDVRNHRIINLDQP